LTINALSAADSILIPVQAEFFCMEGIPDLFHTLDMVRTYFNPQLYIEGILLTMFDERTNLARQVADEIKNSLRGGAPQHHNSEERQAGRSSQFWQTGCPL